MIHVQYWNNIHPPSLVIYHTSDCNWGDHCADVTASFGVISQRTPAGMQLSEFHSGIEKYRKEVLSRNDGKVEVALGECILGDDCGTD